MSDKPYTLADWAERILKPAIDDLIARNKTKGIIWDETLREWRKEENKDGKTH